MLPVEDVTLLFSLKMAGYTVLVMGQTANLDMMRKRIDAGMDDALDLYVLSDRYQVKGLSMQCLAVIERGLTNGNAIRILVEVDGLGLDDLKDVCMSYVVSNYHKVVMNKEAIESLPHVLRGELLVGLHKKNSMDI